MLEYWLWLSGRRGLGVRWLRALLEQFGTPEAVYCASDAEYPSDIRPDGRTSLADKELAPARQILQQCYRQTNLCFSRRYSVERNQILEEETPGETAAEVLEDVKLGELNISSLSQRQAEAFLYTGTREEVSGFVEDYFAQLGDGNVKSIFLRQYVVMDLYVTAVSVLEKSGYKSRDLVERCGDAKEMAAYLTTVEQTREYI